MEEKKAKIEKPAKKKRSVKSVLLLVSIPVILLICFGALLLASFVLDIAKVTDELNTSVNRIAKSFDEIVDDRTEYAEDYDRHMLHQVRFTVEYAFPDGLRGHEAELEKMLDRQQWLVFDENGELLFSGFKDQNDGITGLADIARQCRVSETAKIYNAGVLQIAAGRDGSGDILGIIENPGLKNTFTEMVGTAQELLDGSATETSFSAVTENGVLSCAGSILKDHIGELFSDIVKTEKKEPGSARAGALRLCMLNGRVYLYLSKASETSGYKVYTFVDIVRTVLHSSHAVILLFFFILLYILVLVFYLYQLRKDPSIKTDAGKRNYRSRAYIGSGIVILLVSFTAFYCRTLFCLSNYVMDDQAEITEVNDSLEAGKVNSTSLDALYNYLFTIETEMIGHWVENSPVLPDRRTLTEIADMLELRYIALFDREGKFLISSGDYINLELSERKEDASYELRQLLNGVPLVIIRDKYDDMTCQDVLINACCLREESGVPNGLAACGFDSQLAQKVKNRYTLHEVLDSAKNSALNNYFVVDPETSLITYATDHTLEGMRAQDIGFHEMNLSDHFSGEITINQIPSYATSGSVDGKYLYVTLPNDIIFGSRLIFVVNASIEIFVVLVLILLLMRTVKPDPGAVKKHERYVPVKTDEFTTKMAVSALERLSLQIDWEALNPEEKTGFFIQILMFAVFALIGFTAVIRPEFYTSSPVLMFILEGKWTPGINVYAFTAILIMVLAVAIAVTVVRELLMFISGVLTPKVETACRLLRSFLEYASVIGTVYAALIMLGMDISSLVASAGILTLIVGLGAEDMVADLVSGLFLIFESEFQVGDRIVVNDKVGQVREIGILSTKMVDENNNIFIVNNKEVSDVLNQTVRSSFTLISFELPSSIPIRKVQELFDRELPALKDRYSDLISVPRLRGVRNFSEGKMECQIICEVQEAKRFELTCNMNREIMRIIEILKCEEGRGPAV